MKKSGQTTQELLELKDPEVALRYARLQTTLARLAVVRLVLFDSELASQIEGWTGADRSNLAIGSDRQLVVRRRAAKPDGRIYRFLIEPQPVHSAHYYAVRANAENCVSLSRQIHEPVARTAISTPQELLDGGPFTTRESQYFNFNVARVFDYLQAHRFIG